MSPISDAAYWVGGASSPLLTMESTEMAGISLRVDSEQNARPYAWICFLMT
jgi:hypothetical protein